MVVPRCVTIAISWASTTSLTLLLLPSCIALLAPTLTRRSFTTTAMATTPNADASTETTLPVLIAGAGVVGCTTAYYLAKEFGTASILVDPTGTIAPAASGKAGGFLALDWNDYSPVGPLARRSFGLHQEIANELGASRLDYRRLTCAAIAAAPGDGLLPRPKGKKLEGIEWATGEAVQSIRSLGDEDTIAQVHPLKLCQALWEKTCELAPASKLVKGKVTGAAHAADGTTFLGATVQPPPDGTEEILPGQALLYACGPWTANVMTGVKYHSVVMPTETTLSQCVFFSGYGDPEVYVRPDQTAYCTGFPDPAVHVTEEPGQEQVREEAVKRITTAVTQASNLVAAQGKQSVHQACYLPSTPDGLPLMGALPNQPHCYIATGHSCWGILMGPATGEAMAHLMTTGSSPHVSLAPFDPARVRGLEMVPRAKTKQSST